MVGMAKSFKKEKSNRLVLNLTLNSTRLLYIIAISKKAKGYKCDMGLLNCYIE